MTRMKTLLLSSYKSIPPKVTPGISTSLTYVKHSYKLCQRVDEMRKTSVKQKRVKNKTVRNTVFLASRLRLTFYLANEL